MKGSRLLVLTCYLSFLALGSSVTILGPLFQSLTERFNMPLRDAGTFTFLSFGGSTLIAPLLGRALDRINVRYILSSATLLVGGSLLMLSAAQTLPVAF